MLAKPAVDAERDLVPGCIPCSGSFTVICAHLGSAMLAHSVLQGLVLTPPAAGNMWDPALAVTAHAKQASALAHTQGNPMLTMAVSTVSPCTAPVLQGLVLTAPAVDAERDLALRFLELLRPVLLRLLPGARIVPSIPLEKTTTRADVVSAWQRPVLVLYIVLCSANRIPPHNLTMALPRSFGPGVFAGAGGLLPQSDVYLVLRRMRTKVRRMGCLICC